MKNLGRIMYIMSTGILCFFSLFILVDSCGIITHLFIGHRTKDNFQAITSKEDYHKLMDRHQDAFFAGNAFPDAFETCADKRYKDVAEDTHWAPFLNATINYIRKLPQPWDNSTEKLISFMFGVLSHQVSDILWEGTDLNEGFLTTLANINFHGNITDAKRAADLGGDAVVMYLYDLLLDIDFLDDPEWYVPTDDIYEIFKEFYGSVKINKTVIDNCTTLQLVYAAAEELGLRELYPEVAHISPFLVDHQTEYHIGGIDDMTSWSHRLWKDAVTMLENGTDVCKIPKKNTLFINCTNPTAEIKTENPKYDPHTSIYHRNLSLKDFHVEHRYRGIIITPTDKLKERIRASVKLRRGDKPRKSMRNKQQDVGTHKRYPCYPDDTFSSFTVNNSYSKFAWSFVVRDLDNDGNDDIIVGAPKYTADENSGQGRVYILHGSDSGFMMCDYEAVNVNEFLNFTSFIKAPFAKTDSGFGTSVAVLDVNLDGILDIAVGAPLVGNDYREYNGAVYIYFGSSSKTFEDPSMIINCQITDCNVGYTLAVSDINFDGKDDLVISTPFYPELKPQTGVVSALVSSTKNTDLKTVNFEDLLKSWSLTAKQGFGWFGHKITAKNDVLMISQPHYRICQLPDCSFSPNDTQSVGRLNIYNMGSKVKMTNFTVTGTEEFQSSGYSSDLGYPYGDGTPIMAVGIPGADVNGTVLSIPFKFPQAGIVVLYSITTSGPVEISRFEGHRHYDRFGEFVKFEDVNDDKIDDLIISAPLSTEDWSGLWPFGEVDGKVYIYYGGSDFPKGAASRRNCTDKTVTPCPGVGAHVWDGFADDSRFAYNAAIVKTKKQSYIAFSEPYGNEDEYSALSGVLYVHEI